MPIWLANALICCWTYCVSWFIEPDWSTTQMMSDGSVTKSAFTSSPAHDSMHAPLPQTGRSSGQSALDSHSTHVPLAVQIGNPALHWLLSVHPWWNPPSVPVEASGLLSSAGEPPHAAIVKQISRREP